MPYSVDVKMWIFQRMFVDLVDLKYPNKWNFSRPLKGLKKWIY